MLTAQFVSIGDSDISIQDIVANGDDLNNVAIQTLDAYGRANETFSWNDWAFDAPCWVDDNLDKATRTFEPGEGMWTQGLEGYNIQTAGKVGTSDVVVTLTDGNVAVGNPFPVAVSIQDIVATGADLTNVAIQTLDEYGRAVETFSWNDWAFDEPCWVDDNLDKATRTFAAGEGLWVQGVSGYTLRIPAPEL